MDLASSSGLQNAFLPVVFGIFLITALIKICGSSSHRNNSRGGDSGSGCFWGGNDSGDGGCGGGD
ncbi:MAG: hypothetical protein OFPII_41880 [Osedax symbiont Rs1]|nr:MAG: hypothetical protein OFPII_41880 [Osedax symbiont Rs1]